MIELHEMHEFQAYLGPLGDLLPHPPFMEHKLSSGKEQRGTLLEPSPLLLCGNICLPILFHSAQKET